MEKDALESPSDTIFYVRKSPGAILKIDEDEGSTAPLLSDAIRCRDPDRDLHCDVSYLEGHNAANVSSLSHSGFQYMWSGARFDTGRRSTPFLFPIPSRSFGPA
jgi:hypothetical protein